MRRLRVRTEYRVRLVPSDVVPKGAALAMGPLGFGGGPGANAFFWGAQVVLCVALLAWAARKFPPLVPAVAIGCALSFLLASVPDV